MQKYHGYRYFDWKLNCGALEFSESETRLGREKNIEGKYVIMTREKGLSVLDAVALYKELTDVESGFRQLKDVLSMRPIFHQIELRVKAHIFVAALAFLVQRLLGRRLKEAGVDLSSKRNDGGIVEKSAAGDLPPGGPTGAAGDDRGCPGRPVGIEGPEARRPATAGATRGGGNCYVATGCQHCRQCVW